MEGVTGRGAGDRGGGREGLARGRRAALRAIRYDTAHERIPLPTETGNLIVQTARHAAGRPRLLFSTHLDTVPLCAGAVPVRSKQAASRAKGATALGGDNRTGVACLVTLAATLLQRNCRTRR